MVALAQVFSKTTPPPHQPVLSLNSRASSYLLEMYLVLMTCLNEGQVIGGDRRLERKGAGRSDTKMQGLVLRPRKSAVTLSSGGNGKPMKGI